jgi:hypothetical protein
MGPAVPSIESVLRTHERELLSHPHVTTVGIGHEEGREVILVFVRQEAFEGDPSGRGSVPVSLEGFDVVVRPELLIGGAGN